jgi:acyl-homoserine lactone acylase PvdQ
MLHLSYKRKDGQTVPVDQMRTEFGPIALKLGNGTIFARKSSFWKRELESFSAVYDLYEARSVSDVKTAIDKATLNFNFFYATTDGNIGYHYAGLIPLRAEGLDPRFPTPLTPETDWKGYLPKNQMPGVDNPKSGILFNWNNKPVSWWPNWDTPVWGRIFRNEIIAQQVTKPKMTVADLEMVPWQLARTDYNWWAFAKYLPETGDSWLGSFDGKMLDGSISAGLYSTFFDALREELFTRHIGTLISPDNFKQAVQPSVMLNALEGKTKFDYLAGRTREQVLKAALAKALQAKGPDISTWRYVPGRMLVDEPPIPYSDRGTYIQIIELLSTPSGRNVLPPGVAETGPNASDQAPLSRAWTYKKMGFGG